MINIFRKMKQKSKDRIFSEYPCADFLHNALHFLARNKPEVTYGEICYALLKSGNKLTDEVYWKIPKDLPKMTKLMIDGKALYIHRANFQIIDTALLD